MPPRFFFFHLHGGLSAIEGSVSFLAFLMAIALYGLMGLTPLVPKRLFLPIALFTPVTGLITLPCLIYAFDRLALVAWGVALCQLILGLGILFCAQGGIRLRWPLVPLERLGVRGFSWQNLSLFLLANVFVLLPAVIIYLVACSALAVDHFSDGFMALRPQGFTVRVRKYARKDGKTIQLVPMSHIGETTFYRALSESFPTNSIILMEGVTDEQNLITNQISYKRMATSLGVAEQHEEFKPRGHLVRADVDVEVFTTNTIEVLNLVMLFHKNGLMNRDVVTKTLQYSSPSDIGAQLFDDLLVKRNQHLVQEINARLLQSENLIVPWGVAHMPGIAKEIQKSGFHLVETREYVAIRFHSAADKRKNAGKTEGHEQSK